MLLSCLWFLARGMGSWVIFLVVSHVALCAVENVLCVLWREGLDSNRFVYRRGML